MYLLAAVLLAVVSEAQTPAAAPKLIYTVIISRHGVRSPTTANQAISQYAAEPWPEWGVAPGELTPHGARLLNILGAWYRQWLSGERLLSGTGCEDADAVHARADVDQRTRESGRALAEGMFPGCNVGVHTVERKTDPLFHSVAAGLVRGDSAVAKASVSGRIGGHLDALIPELRHSFELLNEVLFACPAGAACPAAKRPGKQDLLELKASLEGTEDGLADIRGPLRTGSTLAENLLLEYADGKTGRDLGWGRLDETRLNEIMAIHIAYADLARRTPYLARIQGSNLLSHVLDSLEQAAGGKAVRGALGKSGDRLLVLDGHDTNLTHIAGMLNLNWLLPGYQRDDTPPGGALVFRLWRHGDGGTGVETMYIAQTLEQMKNATPLNREDPPAIAPIAIPACSTQGTRIECDWETFRKVVKAAIDPKCVGR
jgi:4-phytase/acid phosphatase